MSRNKAGQRTANRDVLASLTRESRRLSHQARSRGAARSQSRAVDFSVPSIASSRPLTDRGVSFHFRHTYVAKGDRGSRGKDGGGGGRTPAAAHQLYIERNEAVERDALERGQERRQEQSLEQHARDPESQSRAAVGKEAERPTEETTAQDELARPGSGRPVLSEPAKAPGPGGKRDTHEDPDTREELLSFGNIGETRLERTRFWDKVEQMESKAGRVQCRIIAELPHEVDSRTRHAIAKQFCKAFEERGLPHWCVIHAPTEKNDSRNYHMHLVYYDRPCSKTKDGRWDFEHEEEVVYANRTRVKRRPYKQMKDREARGRAWIRSLRERFADANNFYLEKQGHEKRLDPRSYRAAGIPKHPTVHLGPKAWSIEKSGVPTKPGAANSQRETLFRSKAWSTPLAQRIRNMDSLIYEADRRRQTSPRLAQDVTKLAREHRRLSLELASHRRREELHSLVAEAATRRLTLRRDHLEKQSESLGRRKLQRFETKDLVADLATRRELEIIDVAMRDKKPIAEQCAEAIALERRQQLSILRQQRDVASRLRPLQQRLANEPSTAVVSPESWLARKMIESAYSHYSDEPTASGSSEIASTLKAGATGDRTGSRSPATTREALAFTDDPTERAIATFRRRLRSLTDENLARESDRTRKALNQAESMEQSESYRRALLIMHDEAERRSTRSRGPAVDKGRTTGRDQDISLER